VCVALRVVAGSAASFASARALGLRLFIINKKYHNTLGAP
jgi:hypothetical protein